MPCHIGKESELADLKTIDPPFITDPRQTGGGGIKKGERKK
jgi:hypothetical protein